MAKTAEQILKAQGLSDADITAMAPMLTNASYRAAIENTVNSLETERDTYRIRDEEWQQIVNERYVPAVTAAEKQAIDARLEAARYKELAKTAKDFGYLTDDDERKAAERVEAERRATAATQNQGGFNPEDPKFREFSNRFSMAEGDAMATYNFVSEEYRLLNGGSLNDYVGPDGKRGMIALRAEALAAKKPVDQYATEKFNWAGKRAEQAAAAKKAEQDEWFRKGQEDQALKSGTNPHTSTAHSSRNPFIPMQGKEGKQPWERPTATTERRQRAYENETRARVN